MDDQEIPVRVTTAQAVKMLTRATGNRDSAISILIDALSGDVAHATGNTVHFAGQRVAEPIPAACWLRTPANERGSWSWTGGSFILRGDGVLGNATTEFHGVTIGTMDVIDLCEDHDVSSNVEEPGMAPKPASKNPGGAPRDSEKWDAVTVAIARLANEGRLDRNMESRFKSHSEMRRAVLDDADVAKLDVKESTLIPLIRKVFAALLD